MGDGKSHMNNWTVWCTQNVLLSAFTRPLPSETQTRILCRAARSIDYFLDEYGEDGCCDEGAQYYRHAGLCLFGCLEIDVYKRQDHLRVVLSPEAAAVVSAGASAFAVVSAVVPSGAAFVSLLPLPQPASVVTTIAPASARLNALFFIVFPPDLNLVNSSAMHLLVFKKHENKKPGRSALCQFEQKSAYASKLSTHFSVQTAAWLNC